MEADVAATILFRKAISMKNLLVKFFGEVRFPEKKVLQKICGLSTLHGLQRPPQRLQRAGGAMGPHPAGEAARSLRPPLPEVAEATSG